MAKYCAHEASSQKYKAKRAGVLCAIGAAIVSVIDPIITGPALAVAAATNLCAQEHHNSKADSANSRSQRWNVEAQDAEWAAEQLAGPLLSCTPSILADALAFASCFFTAVYHQIEGFHKRGTIASGKTGKHHFIIMKKQSNLLMASCNVFLSHVEVIERDLKRVEGQPNPAVCRISY